MNALPAAAHTLRVVLARAHQHLGAAGTLGGVLLLAALTFATLGWRSHRAALADLSSVPLADPSAPQTGTAAPARTPPSVLPDAAEVPRLLSRIERAAVASGLGWPRADYRVNAATDDLPASVEVRTALRGPYPALRSFVTALLQDTPTLTLKEISLSRANADAAEVEAKLAIVIYVASELPPVRAARP